MEKKYEEWIATFVAHWGGFVGGLCSEATRKMVETFPELKQVRGFVIGGGEHVWCVTESGEIVDPTVSQFNHLAKVKYKPWKPGMLVRMGRCMNCGDDIYGRPQALGGTRKSVCGKECEDILLAEFNSEAP